MGTHRLIYNNAGIIGPLAPIWDLCPEHIQKVMDVNLHGMIYMIQAFTPSYLNKHLIRISSI